MAKRSFTSPFSSALLRIRQHLGFQQAAFAEHLGVSRRSVVRWERCDCEPHPNDREQVLRAVRDLPFELVEPLAASLGYTLDPHAHAGGTDRAKSVLDAHLHAIAERADVSARRLREAVVGVLDKASELRLTVEGARALLAGGKRG